MYTKVHKTSFYDQGLTRKNDCFHGLLKNWTASDILQKYLLYKNHANLLRQQNL
jgi:hypothetical protein